MGTRVITDKVIQNLKPKQAPYLRFDPAETGLAIKVQPGGKKLFVLHRIYPGAKFQSDRALGTYPGVGLAEARAKAKIWNGWIEKGIDPRTAEQEAADREAAAQAAAIANTFGAVVDAYCLDHLAGKAHARVDERDIRKELLPQWGDKPVTAIKPADVVDLIQQIKKRGPRHAKNMLGHIKTIFQWAFQQTKYGLENSPAAMIKPRYVLGTFDARANKLTDDELAAYWHAAGDLEPPLTGFLRLMLLTGARRTEAAGARYSELHPKLRRILREAKTKGLGIDWAKVSDDLKIWTVPPARFKSKHAHVITLSHDALTILENLERIEGSDFIFTHTGKKPINSFSKIKVALDAAMLEKLKELATERGDDPDDVTLNFVNHDLRRNVRSALSALGVATDVAELCIGHGRKGLQAVYNQDQALPAMRKAFELWAEKLRQIIEPDKEPDSNVVPESVVEEKRRKRK